MTARVPDNDRARLQAILDRSGVDLGRRREAYRQSGWNRFDEKSQPYTPDQVRRERQLYGASNREGVEGELRVGKREVDQGGVKVKSHVVETPVTEDVSLQQERVNVERRPVNRPLSANERAFQDRTIEVEQKGQEAVVSKEARVKEEVVVNKDVQHRNQKVSDTVRRTEVEVEDERTKRGAPEPCQVRTGRTPGQVFAAPTSAAGRKKGKGPGRLNLRALAPLWVPERFYP